MFDILTISLLSFIFSIIRHSGFNQKIIIHILEFVFIEGNHIFLSEINLKFMELLVVGGRLVGGFKETQVSSVLLKMKQKVTRFCMLQSTGLCVFINSASELTVSLEFFVAIFHFRNDM